LYILAVFKEYLVYQLPEDDDIAPKPVGGLINYTNVYVVYACFELIKNKNTIHSPCGYKISVRFAVLHRIYKLDCLAQDRDRWRPVVSMVNC
jgi:hypothetical protein